MAGSRSLAEQETIVRWDREDPVAVLWTANANDARKWQRWGWPVIERPGGWRAEVPKGEVAVRRKRVLGPEARERMRARLGTGLGRSGSAQPQGAVLKRGAGDATLVCLEGERDANGLLL